MLVWYETIVLNKYIYFQEKMFFKFTQTLQKHRKRDEWIVNSTHSYLVPSRYCIFFTGPINSLSSKTCCDYIFSSGHYCVQIFNPCLQSSNSIILTLNWDYVRSAYGILLGRGGSNFFVKTNFHSRLSYRLSGVPSV